MAGAGKWILGVIGLAVAAGLSVLPAPAFRPVWLTESRLAWIQAHRECLEYTSYLTEILLILLFGGVIFAASFGLRIKSAADRHSALNEERLRELTAEALAHGNTISELMGKLPAGEKVTLEQGKAAFRALVGGRNITDNPFNWLRVIAFIAAKTIPGGVYGTGALLLFVVKCLVDSALMALPE